jgi:hypothetical protein
MSVICQHCGKPLEKSQYKKDNKYKSCPKCSRDNGKEHVFYEYPKKFGTTPTRSSRNSPEGAQSHCAACRGRGVVTTNPGILCSKL